MDYTPQMQRETTFGETVLKTSVVLVGMMGAGKTAVGKALADRFGVGFMDSDHEIERAANATIPEIFERDGEAFFRQAEQSVIERLLNGPPLVLGTGGGAFMNEHLRQSITARGAVSVFLDVPPQILWDRVRTSTHRPLLKTENPKERLQALLEQRRPTYLLADLPIALTGTTTITDTAACVEAALRTHGTLG